MKLMRPNTRNVATYIVVVSFWVVELSVLVSGGPAEDSWRYADRDDRAMLYIADTDKGTDAIGSPWFNCKRSSGSIEVGAVMNEAEREAFAELIRRERYPEVQLVPSAGYASLAQPSYSEITGWEYKFTIKADSHAFNNFRDTGVFQFKIGGALIRTDFKIGLENVARFQRACRKPQ